MLIISQVSAFKLLLLRIIRFLRSRTLSRRSMRLWMGMRRIIKSPPISRYTSGCGTARTVSHQPLFVGGLDFYLFACRWTPRRTRDFGTLVQENQLRTPRRGIQLPQCLSLNSGSFARRFPRTQTRAHTLATSPAPPLC